MLLDLNQPIRVCESACQCVLPVGCPGPPAAPTSWTWPEWHLPPTCHTPSRTAPVPESRTPANISVRVCVCTVLRLPSHCHKWWLYPLPLKHYFLSLCNTGTKCSTRGDKRRRMFTDYNNKKYKYQTYPQVFNMRCVLKDKSRTCILL